MSSPALSLLAPRGWGQTLERLMTLVSGLRPCRSGEHWSQGLLHLPAVWYQGRRAQLGQGSGVGREDRKGAEGLAG